MDTGFLAGIRCRATALTIVLLLSSFAGAQVKPQITQNIDPAKRTMLGRTVHPLIKSASDYGRADAELPMKDMLLILRPAGQQLETLKKYVDDLHNPNSPRFHQWLTPEQYASQFGASDEDVKTVTAWLASNGFSVDQVARGKNWIRFSGYSSQVEKAFRTEIHQYSMNGVKSYANATPLSIPAALTPAVSGLVSTNNFLSTPQHVDRGQIVRNEKGKLVRMEAGKPLFTNPSDQEQMFLSPADFSTIYNSKSLLDSGVNGSGVSIAIVGRSDISLSDVEAFRTVFGLPFNDPTVIYASTDPGVIPGDDEEAILDVEWSGAVAPQAKINYVIGASTASTDGVNVAASYIVDNALSPIMSLSFGLCESNMSDAQVDFYHNLWQQAAAQGMTVLVSSGDAGSSGCNSPSSTYTTTGLAVNGLASTPYNIAVGGTEFNEPDINTFWSLQNDKNQASAKGYVPEAVWNESCNGSIIPGLTNCYFPPYYLQTAAGGGGASSCAIRSIDPDTGDEICAGGYAKPSWQTGTGVPDDGVRDLPDVSLAAAGGHDGYMICYNGSCQWSANEDGSITVLSGSIIGGTSAAAPSMAGIMALVEQQHGQFQGVANYQLYKLASAESDIAACDSAQRIDPTKPTSCIFNDVTQGSNAVPCQSGSPDCTVTGPKASAKTNPQIVLPPSIKLLSGYSATPGFDLATGLGSVDVANLVNGWGVNNTLPSTTTLNVSQTTFQHGTPVTVNAQVAPASGTGKPTGEVLLQAGGTGTQSFSLTDGAVSASTIDLPGGTYNLTGHYSGDATYSSSTSDPISVTVTPEDSTLTGTTFAYSPFYVMGKRPLKELTAARLDEPFFIQVQVAGASGSTKATGSIEVLNGTDSFGTYPVDLNGMTYITCGPSTPCDLGIGSYTFTAKYSGDASFAPSTTTIPFTVNQGLIYWDVVLNTQTPAAGGQVIATVYLSNDPKVMPTGTITLTRDDTGEALGSGTLGPDGTTVISFLAPAGTYYVAGAYSGDANYIAVSQRLGEQIITTNASGTAATTTAVNFSVTSVPLGQRTQVNVTTTPVQPNNAMPIGTVTLYSANTQISAPLELMGGKASGIVEWDNVGAQNVYAVYSGDSHFATSNSPTVPVTVTPGVTSLNLSSPMTYVAKGSQATVTAVLNLGTSSTAVAMPTGGVQFYDSVDGGTPQPIGTPQPLNIGNNNTILATLAPALTAGAHTITARYAGDTNWQTATSGSVQLTVTTPDFNVKVTPNPFAVVAGQAAPITISTEQILGYTGTIALSCGGTLPVGVSCNATSIASGAAGNLVLTTTAPGTATQTVAMKHSQGLWGLAGSASFALVAFCFLPRRRRLQGMIVALLAISVTGAMLGCGNGSSSSSSQIHSSIVSLSSSATKVATGRSVTFMATISGTMPSGTVTFYDGTTALGNPASVTNGVATLSTASLGVGTHTITAKYSGDAKNAASGSANAIQQTVTGEFTLVVNATSGNLVHTINVPATLQ